MDIIKVRDKETGQWVGIPALAGPKGDKGTTVRVTDGTFKGVVGKVARYCGHQRVAIIIDGIVTIATTYIPSAYLEKID